LNAGMSAAPAGTLAASSNDAITPTSLLMVPPADAKSGVNVPGRHQSLLPVQKQYASSARRPIAIR
jgi:hypothetical protein